MTSERISFFSLYAIELFYWRVHFEMKRRAFLCRVGCSLSGDSSSGAHMSLDSQNGINYPVRRLKFIPKSLHQLFHHNFRFSFSFFFVCGMMTISKKWTRVLCFIVSSFFIIKIKRKKKNRRRRRKVSRLLSLCQRKKKKPQKVLPFVVVSSRCGSLLDIQLLLCNTMGNRRPSSCLQEHSSTFDWIACVCVFVIYLAAATKTETLLLLLQRIAQRGYVWH